MNKWWLDADWLSRNSGKLFIMFGVVVLVGVIVIFVGGSSG